MVWIPFSPVFFFVITSNFPDVRTAEDGKAAAHAEKEQLSSQLQNAQGHLEDLARLREHSTNLENGEPVFLLWCYHSMILDV
jgi:hypothetical protein